MLNAASTLLIPEALGRSFQFPRQKPCAENATASTSPGASEKIRDRSSDLLTLLGPSLDSCPGAELLRVL